MPGNAFIKFTGTGEDDKIAGESLQETHPASEGWLEISDWDFEIAAETNFMKGTGAAVGVAVPGTLNFTHAFDKSSPRILKNIVLGTSFKTATIHMLKSTGDASGKPEVYFGVKCRDVFITSVNSKGTESGEISQDVSFVFKEIALAYKNQKNDGKLYSVAQRFGWNIATKVSATGYDVALDPKKD